jgi:predicted Zn-dependent protease
MLGQTLELLGQRYEAAEAYQTALAQQPALRTSLAALRLAELLMRLGRLFEAQSLLSGLVTALPTEPRVLQLWMEQQIRRKEFDSARATADHLLAMQPENPVWPALQADLLLREGKAAEAEALIRAALTEKPAAIPLLASLARVLFIQKRPDEAEQVVREAAAQSEDVAHQFLLTSVYLMLGRRTEAEAILKNLEATANQDANIWAACSENWGRLGRRDRQLAAARKSLSLLGEDPAVSLRLARILMQGGTADEVQEAAMLVQKRLGQNPNDKAARVLAARIVLLRNPPNLAEAEQALEEILARDPLWTEARSLLCSVQLARGRSEAARSTIRVGLAITPDDPALLLASAQVHYAVSENIAVIQTTSRLLESQPRALQALLLLASAYERSGRALEAIEVISRHFSEDLATPEEISILAGLHESASNFDQAERLRRRACELDPPGGEAYHDLIHFFARRRDYAQIRALAEEHAARHPRDFQSLAAAAEALSCACTEPAFREVGERWFDQLAGEESDGAADVLYRSARCFYQCEELDRAEARFLESIRRRPTHRPAVNDLSWLYAEDLSRPREALMIIERFTAGGGELDGHLLDTRGLAYLNLRQWEAAEQSLNAGLRIADSPRTRTSATYHLGLVYWNVGRKAEAASYMRQATHLDGQFGGLSVKQRSIVREVLDGGDAPG